MRLNLRKKSPLKTAIMCFKFIWRMAKRRKNASYSISNSFKITYVPKTKLQWEQRRVGTRMSVPIS